MREALVKSSVSLLSPKCGWLVDDTGFPKKGTHSVGVARQYSGTLGKIGNCQIGVSLNYATDEGCIPVDFELYLPEEWVNDAARRRRAGVPEEVQFKAKWQLALDMIERALRLSIPVGVVSADAGYGVTGRFREGLGNLQLRYVLGVQKTTGVWLTEEVYSPPEYQGCGHPRKHRYDLAEPQSVLEVAQALPLARDLAAAFHQFYTACKVLDESDPTLSTARMALVRATRIVLANMLSLMGLAVPERM